jgi:hypothetical protein
VREIDLAVYADALAGEAAALSARAERIRSKLRQAKIERRARNDLTAATVDTLESLGLLGGIDERAAHAELRELRSRSRRSRNWRPGSKKNSPLRTRRDGDQEPAVVVVGGKEIGGDRLSLACTGTQLEPFAEPSHAPFER